MPEATTDIDANGGESPFTVVVETDIYCRYYVDCGCAVMVCGELPLRQGRQTTFMDKVKTRGFVKALYENLELVEVLRCDEDIIGSRWRAAQHQLSDDTSFYLGGAPFSEHFY